MIGSGIFLVDADIARTANSPALVLGAWVVTGILTVIGALSYGELAAMMPKAGGQYVYLRESLGPLWGFLYGWTLFLVIQTGTIAAVCVAFGKFLGVFFPSISTTHWLWHIAHVPPVKVGPMVLGNMEIGVNTANLTGIVIVFFLAFVNMFGVKLGAIIQNVFTSAKALSLAALVLLTLTVGRNATAMAANFGQRGIEFWKNAGWSALHPVQVGIGGPIVLVNLLVILAVVQVGSLFSADAWNNITFTAGEVKNPRRNIPLSLIMGTGFVVTVYFLATLGYLMVLPMHGDPHGATALARGMQFASEDRVATAALEVDVPLGRRIPDGGCDPDLDLRMRERNVTCGRAGLLRHEPGWPVLQIRRQVEREVQDALGWSLCAGLLDRAAMRLRLLQPVARLHHLRRACLLHPDDHRIVRAARQTAWGKPAIQGARLSGSPCALYRHGFMDLYRIIAIQASIHMAGPGSGLAGNPGLSFLVAPVCTTTQE